MLSVLTVLDLLLKALLPSLPFVGDVSILFSRPPCSVMPGISVLFPVTRKDSL